MIKSVDARAAIELPGPVDASAGSRDVSNEVSTGSGSDRVALIAGSDPVATAPGTDSSEATALP